MGAMARNGERMEDTYDNDRGASKSTAANITTEHKTNTFIDNETQRLPQSWGSTGRWDRQTAIMMERRCTM